jgi:hypothetical protein
MHQTAASVAVHDGLVIVRPRIRVQRTSESPPNCATMPSARNLFSTRRAIEECHS